MISRSWFRVPVLFGCLAIPVFAAGVYVQTNLVSDIPGLAPGFDASLVNPWGLSSSPTSPWWVSDNGAGVSTLYNGTGGKVALTVTIPPPPGGNPPSAPTGQIFNTSSTDFKVGGSATNFIFATEGGTIAARVSGTTSSTVVDNSASGAVYKGLAVGNNGSGNFLYAANFNAGTIDVFNGTFAATSLSGSFTDPNLPAGYAPFNIQNLGGKLYVTYAKQDQAKHDDVAGAGFGVVDVFDTNGNLLQRVTSGGALDSPWGVALAPSSFGSFSGDLLVGNFGDGAINVFDPGTGSSVGQLMDINGNPIVIQGLWALAFGTGSSGSGPANSLFFTAGIAGGGDVEDHGLFGVITFAPEPSAIWLTIGGLGLLAVVARRRTTGPDGLN